MRPTTSRAVRALLAFVLLLAGSAWAAQLRVTLTRDYQEGIVTLPQGTVIDLPENLARALAQAKYADITPGASNPTPVSPASGSLPPTGSITNGYLADVATGTVKGRTTAGTGVPTDIPIATTLKTALSLVAGDVGLGSVDNTSDATKNAAAATLTNKTLTSPKVGTSLLDVNGNAFWTLTATGSAVNAVTFANAATGTDPTWTASGTDSNIGLNLASKGTGTVKVNGVEIGYRHVPQNSRSAAYTTTLADCSKHLLHPSADTTARIFTIDSNANVAAPIGCAISIVNEDNAGALTIAITSDTLLYAATGGSGSRTCTTVCIVTILKIGTTKWIISGTGLS